MKDYMFNGDARTSSKRLIAKCADWTVYATFQDQDFQTVDVRPCANLVFLFKEYQRQGTAFRLPVSLMVGPKEEGKTWEAWECRRF